MSFGGVIIDQHGFIERFPGTSLICGLLANALGWDHGEADKLNRLQGRIVYAARWDAVGTARESLRTPRRRIDYHTVDMSQRHMVGPSWTTRGVPETHGSTTAGYTHQRYRHYWEDCIVTVAVHLRGSESPDVEDLSRALVRPARPLFIGRKSCLPSRPILDPENPILEGEDIYAILRAAPVWDRYGAIEKKNSPRFACWPADLVDKYPGQIENVADRRDWANQLPAGSTYRVVGMMT